MRRSFPYRFLRDQNAAIAPMYAVGIAVLVTMSAVGFDYGRLMALDSELQNAADQAALAAATQLDGNNDAMSRARDAANNSFASADSTFTNETRFANDRQGRPITSLTFRFFDGYSEDTHGAEVADDDDGATARVVEVTVNARKVFYSLTPLVGAMNSGDVIGRALAGLQSAQCDITPMFFCLPHDGEDDPIRNFPRPEDAGRQLKLHLRNNQAETFTPGNFGFLDVDWGTQNERNLKLGLNTGTLGCFASTPDQNTEPGSRTPEGRSLNTRLDMYDSQLKASDCEADSGDFCPSENVTRDWVNVQELNNVATAVKDAATCNATPNGNWTRYNDNGGVEIDNPGYPDDGAFTGVLGSGDWSASAWMTLAHPGNSLDDVTDVDGNGSISRYEAHLWELENPSSRLADRLMRKDSVLRNNGRWNVTMYCAYPQPEAATPVAASDEQKDRRILTVGAVDCSADPPNGSDDVRVMRWVDLFLTRPVNSGSETQFYSEVIGLSRRPNGDSGFQYYGRKKAVLIR